MLNRYEIFLKVAEVGNITRTAEILHYTQAGVSHAVAAMEREAGFSLFVRSSSGVELTENGKRLLPAVQALVNEQSRVAQAIYDIHHVVAGTIRVGTFTSVSVNWLPRIIRAFTARYPDVRFELLAGNYDEITEQIRSGKIDCGFLTAPVAEELFFLPLYDDPMMAVLSPTHPLAEKAALTFADLRGQPFILPLKGSDKDLRAVTDRYLKGLEARYTLNDDHSVVALAENGFGITIMSELILRSFHTNAAVRPLEPMQCRRIGVASLPMNRVSLLTRTFMRFLSGETVSAGERA